MGPNPSFLILQLPLFTRRQVWRVFSEGAACYSHLKVYIVPSKTIFVSLHHNCKMVWWDLCELRSYDSCNTCRSEFRSRHPGILENCARYLWWFVVPWIQGRFGGCTGTRSESWHRVNCCLKDREVSSFGPWGRSTIDVVSMRCVFSNTYPQALSCKVYSRCCQSVCMLV